MSFHFDLIKRNRTVQIRSESIVIAFIESIKCTRWCTSDWVHGNRLTASLLFPIYISLYISLLELICVKFQYLLDIKPLMVGLLWERIHPRSVGYSMKSLQISPLRATLISHYIHFTQCWKPICTSTLRLKFACYVHFVCTDLFVHCFTLVYRKPVVHFNFSPIFNFFSTFHCCTIGLSCKLWCWTKIC